MDIKPKEFYTIGEASKILGLKEHVLRFWEKEFSELAPMKSKSGRRKYSNEDIKIVQRIKNLLYVEGFTIQGAQKQLGIEVHDLRTQNQLTPIEDVKEMNQLGNKQYENQLRFQDIEIENESPATYSRQNTAIDSHERKEIIARLKEIVQALK